MSSRKPAPPSAAAPPGEAFDPLRNPALHQGPIEYLPRNFRVSLEDRVRAMAGPPAWMRRARRLERHLADLEAALERAWRAGAPATWEAQARAWDLSTVNREIAAYNDYFPVERGLPMDPRLRDFTRDGGRWRPEPLVDTAWILARFPAAGAGASSRAS